MKRLQSVPLTLGDWIRTDQCLKAISLEMADFLNRSEQRITFESEILAILSQSVHFFDPALKVLPFGSTDYGFGGSKTNYNLLIDTRKSLFPMVCQ